MSKSQLGLIREAQWNYHKGNLGDLGKVRPHYSDNKYMMRGRDTGHFGSGMYFSTYPYEKHNSTNPNPNLIQIGDGVYRVDFDLYKNLYRVRNKRHGELLFNTLRIVNAIYSKVDEGNFNCSQEYRILERNCPALGLRIPSYRELLKLAQSLKDDKSYVGSFSTKIMEMNGFNGVNVSGIPEFDNTLHGSVIYDVNKVSKDIVPVNVDMNKIPWVGRADVATNDELNDMEYKVLSDDRNLSSYSFRNMDKEQVLKYLKFYKFPIDNVSGLSYLFGEETLKQYLVILYRNIMRGFVTDTSELLDRDYLNVILETKSYQFVNVPPVREGQSVFLSLATMAYWDDDLQLLNSLQSNLKRELDYKEREKFESMKQELSTNQ